MRYINTSDGHEYEASSAAELVAQMHEMAGLAGSDADWMKTASQGIAILFDGKSVRCSSADFFVEDLLTIGLLKVIKWKSS